MLDQRIEVGELRPPGKMFKQEAVEVIIEARRQRAALLVAEALLTTRGKR